MFAVILSFGAVPSVTAAAPEKAASDSAAPAAPEKVEVEPVAKDVDISERLVGIYQATGWFEAIDASVRDGVVFLTGSTTQDKYRDWAESLAQKTEGVVAVVNQIEVKLPDRWDFTPAGDELREMSQNLIRSLPILVVALLVLMASVLAARLVRGGMQHMLQARIKSQLLRDVAARTCGILLLLLGLYLVLRISGLSRLAVTVVGGTGLVGLVLGIAFRDITENFLASLFLSMQNPFREGDLVDVGGTLGFVEKLTSRTTVLTTPDGVQVQIPNATVFKSTIRNLTSNPHRQDSFIVGIGYDDAIQTAQEAALRVLTGHPAVLADPEPWVLVDGLGASTVNLKVYYWMDIHAHSLLKVRSSLIRLVKNAFVEVGVSIPDEAREIVFPKGVPVRMLEAEHPDATLRSTKAVPPDIKDKDIATAGEKSLQSEASEIKRQGRIGWVPEQGENLLADVHPNPAAGT
ncbi:MAG: mechanosensitive ion channel domain-containing protein [Pirellulales bacterium]